MRKNKSSLDYFDYMERGIDKFVDMLVDFFMITLLLTIITCGIWLFLDAVK